MVSWSQQLKNSHTNHTLWSKQITFTLIASELVFSLGGEDMSCNLCMLASA